MAWRKWIVRGVVYGIIGACAAGALAYQRWTNPVAVREQIIAKLSEIFPGAEVSVDSARLRILGGIQLNGLRMCRKDDPEKHEFLHVPSAIFYHDKEKILEGELTLRKIELIRPRLRARRDRNGQWSLQGLLRKPNDKPKSLLPAIVVQQGTLILEDRLDPAKTANIEINDLNMTIINDPLPRVTIQGAANSELLGKLQMQGTLDRVSNEVFVSFKAIQVPLTQTLLARLPIKFPPDMFATLELSAMANVEGTASYHPSLPQPIYYDLNCDVTNGKVQHKNLPLPLDQLNLKLHCKDGGVQLEKLTARSGVTLIAAHGVAQLPGIDKEFEVHIDLKHVMLGKELAARLPDKLRELHALFDPKGPTAIHIACARHEGQWVSLNSGEPSRVSLRPENIALAFKGFPYPLEQTTGNIDYNVLNKHVSIELVAHADDRPVILNGYWNGEGAQADVKFDIIADDLPIDEKIFQALKTENLAVLHDFSKSFHASGKLNVAAHIRREPGQKFSNKFQLHFHEAAVCWDNFPYALTNVSGTLVIYPKYWAIRQFQGTHKGGHVLVHGQSAPTDDKGESHGITLEITGRNVALDDDLRNAVEKIKGLHDAWLTFRPQGNLFFTATVDRPSSDLRELNVKVDARGAWAKPAFFPYMIQDISGQFHFHDNRLEIKKLRAKHDQTLIALDAGEVDINARGGYWADFKDLQVLGFYLNNDFIQALPSRKLQDAAKALRLDDPLRISTRLVMKQPPETGKPPEVYWDGKLQMYDASITTGMDFSHVTGEVACKGLANGSQIVGVEGNLLVEQAVLYKQPFKKIHAHFQMRKESPDVMLVGLHAPIFGGDVTGEISVAFNSTLRYEMNLTASKINVAEFGRDNLGPKSQISGIADARLYLTGIGNGTDEVNGNGSINIPRGHIYNLPHLLDLLKLLGLNLPDRTGFEELHSTFNIQGTKVSVQKIDLLGNTLSLSGKGEFDLASRELQLEVYPMFGRVEQLFPTQIRLLPSTFSKNLLTVDVRGKVSANTKDLKYNAKPLPMIYGPLLRMIAPPGGGEKAPPAETRLNKAGE